MSGFFMAGPSTFMAAIPSSDNGAGGRTRTGTEDNLRGILSPLRPQSFSIRFAFFWNFRYLYLR